MFTYSLATKKALWTVPMENYERTTKSKFEGWYILRCSTVHLLPHPVECPNYNETDVHMSRMNALYMQVRRRSILEQSPMLWTQSVDSCYPDVGEWGSRAFIPDI